MCKLSLYAKPLNNLEIFTFFFRQHIFGLDKQHYGGNRRTSSVWINSTIILSQEKSIQKLNELVRSLREQLLQCRGENEIVNGISAPLTELLSELERHPLLED
ncbi:unnamed protein product [Malus baccata var. baccata]